MTSNFRMIKPRCISSQNSRHCEIDVSNCWNELYRDTSWLPCSKYQILNQTNVRAIYFDKSCWFVKNWESEWIWLTYLFSYSASGKRLKLWSSETVIKRPILNFLYRCVRIWRQCDRVARARWSHNLLAPGSDPHHTTLWIFFRLPSVLPIVCGCALFIANLNYYSISYNVLPLLDTFVVDWYGEPPA